MWFEEFFFSERSLVVTYSEAGDPTAFRALTDLMPHDRACIEAGATGDELDDIESRY